MPTEEKTKYIETVGRRKTAVARVRLTPSSKSSCVVNGKELLEYFRTDEARRVAGEALIALNLPGKFKITATIKGGGGSGQAEALRHGVARALIIYDTELRKNLKKIGFLKRDPRAKERRKFGLKKARKAPQWSKR
ncbi:30S ribosomal protein S9 [Patescibacteria group bacterium]|nr:30S ribosomal protein S9 [Patescibacteria group bacterium]